MIHVHLMLLALRYGFYVLGTLVLLFVGYLLTVPLTDGYQQARAAADSLPALMDERLALQNAHQLALQQAHARAGELDRLQQGLAEAQQAQQTTLLEQGRALAARQDTGRVLGAAHSTLLARAGALQTSLGLNLDTVPSTSADFGRWVERAQRQADATCTAEWGDLTEWNRVQGLVAGRLSQACAQRHALFSQMRATSVQWANAERAVEGAQQSVDRVQQTLEQQLAAVATLQSSAGNAREGVVEADGELSRLERALLHNQMQTSAAERLTRSTTGWVVALRAQLTDYESWLWVQWRWFWPRALALLLAAWLLPYALRALNFYGVAPLVMRTQPIVIAGRGAERSGRPPAAPTTDDAGSAMNTTATADGRGEEDRAGQGVRVRTFPSERTAAVALGEGERIFVRPDRVRQVESGCSRTRWLLDSENRGQSWMFGLFGLTEVTGPANGTRMTLAATDRDAADTYVMRVDLENHPAFVIQPRHVVALTDGLVLGARWRWGLHAWMRLQFRYIVVRGTGSIWLEGYGDVTAAEVGERESHQETAAYVAWDGRLRMRLRRRETAWPYVLGRMELFETGMAGEGVFVWQKASSPTGRTGVERAVGAFWSALGKILGF